MPRRHPLSRLLPHSLTLLLTIALLGCGQATRAADGAAASESAASATPAREAPAGEALSEQTWRMASEGKLTDVWRRVEDIAAQAGEDAPVAALRRDIAAYRANEQQRRESVRQTFERTLENLKEHVEQGEIEKAMGEAVQAYKLAEDPEQFLRRDVVQGLVEKAERRAAEATEAAEWLEALAYYRSLEMLYENEGRYKEQLYDAAHRVSLLRLYAPNKLFALYAKEAEERGEEPPENWALEDDRWQTQLERIEPGMIKEAVRLGARRHVEEGDYKELLTSGLDALKLFLQTEGVEATFPALGDPEKVKPLLDHIETVRRDLAQNDMPLTYGETQNILDRLLRLNAQTVDLPTAVVVHELGDGAMSTLDDFSSIIWPHQKSRFERTTEGEFSGVGIQIQLIDRQLTVVSPLEDTPAQRAGIRSGDRIVTIDGKSTLGITLQQAVERITGEEGTTVVLGIQSPGDEEPRDVPLVRSSIKITSVKGWDHRFGGGWDFYIDPEAKIGYVRMTTFGPNTADELDAAVQQMSEAKGVNGLILDLRFNPGGRLDAAVAVANRFLDEGTIVSTTQKTFLGGTWEATADAAHTFRDFPVVVLINNGSASASEIVSGALQDHGRALVVGERSFGKGSVQNLFRIGGGEAYLKLTTQYYKLPDGRIIHRRPGAENWGIHPDVEVEMTDEQVANLLRARTVLDVLREEGEEFNPESILRGFGADEDEEDGEEGDGEQAEEKDLPPVDSPEDILTRGMDPQLQTALLLLKTRLLGDATDLTRK